MAVLLHAFLAESAAAVHGSGVSGRFSALCLGGLFKGGAALGVSAVIWLDLVNLFTCLEFSCIWRLGGFDIYGWVLEKICGIMVRILVILRGRLRPFGRQVAAESVRV